VRCLAPPARVLRRKVGLVVAHGHCLLHAVLVGLLRAGLALLPCAAARVDRARPAAAVAADVEQVLLGQLLGGGNNQAPARPCE